MRTLTTNEVAIDLGLNIRSVQRYINEGFLPGMQVKGTKGQIEYVVDSSDYQTWKTKHFQGLKRGKISKANRQDGTLMSLLSLKNLP